MEQEERLAQLRVIRSKKISNATYWALIKQYGSAKNALRESQKYVFCQESVIHDEIDSLHKIGGQFVFIDDALYPPNLKLIPQPPPVLSFLGNTEVVSRLLKQPTLSVVGSRNATLNGMRFCYGICSDLSNSGVTIVSGLARGIDSSAHKGSLSHGTIAVLAGGVNYIYPPENKPLYEQILQNGGVYSEMAYNTYPTAGLFPRRNGIIAGMSDGTLIVEAAQKSGSLITATLAKKFNRYIFAVPNSPLDVRSQGTNDLLKKGALLVTCANDVKSRFFPDDLFAENEIDAEKFNYKTMGAKNIKDEILRLIDSYSIQTADLISCIDAPVSEIMKAIVDLEIERMIKRTINGKIIYIGR